mgnify:CR=1 FL=1
MRPVCRREDDDVIGVFVTVRRFRRPAVMDGILPVVVVFVLGGLRYAGLSGAASGLSC